MHEVDDRLAGDPVWELFPGPGPVRSPGSLGGVGYRRWLTLAVLVVAGWLVFPPLAVVTACVAAAARDFRAGRHLARSIPDKAGGRVCARFTYAWAAWKLGLTAFVLMFVTAIVFAAFGGRRAPPSGLLASVMLWMGGSLASAALTASGLLTAYRSGMRVWIGEGVNQARALLLGMLLVGFTIGVLGPLSLWLVGQIPHPRNGRGDGLPYVLGFFGCMFVGPVVILLVLDGISRRVVADRPGKFGPKVPAVGKWNSSGGHWKGDDSPPSDAL